MHENGWGEAPNYQKAIEHYESASSKFSASASLRLGMLYQQGLGAEQDNQKAAVCFVRALQLGSIDAWYPLRQLLESAVDISRLKLRLVSLDFRGRSFTENDKKLLLKIIQSKPFSFDTVDTDDAAFDQELAAKMKSLQLKYVKKPENENLATESGDSSSI